MELMQKGNKIKLKFARKLYWEIGIYIPAHFRFKLFVPSRSTKRNKFSPEYYRDTARRILLTTLLSREGV
jgi:hypothetical protein